MGERMLTAEGLTKEFAPEIRVIEDMSFSVERGRSLTISGPSGCGKSTLLYMLAGLSRPTAAKTGFPLADFYLVQK